uniref:VASt domain-containing protein n=1 Tax=Astatotilapia calliptera TaxID=8154 RepID=A0A3P8PJK4_ASTCA
MTMSPPARPEGMTLAQPIPVPMLTVLPPSSDTESWSCSPSPRPLRSDRPRGSHRSRTRTKRRKQEEQGCAYKPQWGKTPQIVIQSSTERGAVQHRSPSPSLVTEMGTAKQGRDSPSHDLLIPPSRSWSRSPSPSRRSRWSLRSLLSRDSDGDRCSTASNSPRSTPGSSPSLRRRVLGGGRASENEAGGEKSSSGGGGGAGSDGALPSIPSASSLSSAYPIASRHFSRNAKKMQSWYNVLSPTYKQRNEDFRKIFKKLPDSERLIVDYSCALQKDILLQGRLYLSENWLCFYSNIFRWETTITILLKDVTSMTKEKTAKLIPNAIQISTDNEKHFFTSFGARDRSYMMIFRLWQNALLDKSLSPKELWHIVHQCYGTELGLTSEDDDYVSPTAEHMNEGGDSLSESANHMLPPPTASLGNLSSLDITNDEDLPTDPSNSSDTQEESEVEAFCADLSGRLLINTAVRMSVDKLHDLLFSADTHFIQHLFSQRHFTDLSVGEWQQDGSSGNTSRVLSYTIALNNPLGPKTAPVVETQTLQKSSARGECYVVDSEVITSGIPYQDYFYTVHRYCLTSINKHKSRLRVSSDICYRKQPWSLVKALIEKNTWSGIEEYYKHMGESGHDSDLCALSVPVSLVVLVALNMLLFYKLYALERAAHTLETWHSYSVADSPLPQTAGEWAQVLQLQRQFHQAQLSKWQQILQSSVSLLDQVGVPLQFALTAGFSSQIITQRVPLSVSR